MRSYRRQFGRLISSWAGDFGRPRAAAAGTDGDDARANVVWAICFVLALIVSIGLLYLYGQAVQLVLATLWGAFLGLTLLFYLPRKLLITIVGGILGSGLTKLSDIVEMLKNFASTAKEISDVLNGIFGAQLAIQNGSVFLFMLLVVLCCLPSYRGQGE